MKSNDKNSIPSPYQDAGGSVGAKAQGKSVYLGRMYREISSDGKATYTLFDPTGRPLGSSTDNEKEMQRTWEAISAALEKRARDLKNIRDDKDEKGQDKSRGK